VPTVRGFAVAAVVVLFAGGVSSACGGGGSTKTSAAGTTVIVTEKEYSIALSARNIKAGPVRFQVTNSGSMVHEFVLFKTTLAGDALPQKEGLVDEAAPGVQRIQPAATDIAVGTTKTLSASLSPGSYVATCNLVGHYQLGMRAAITIVQ
jgi:uncharacterized cupredoxin-like copper-binding protein